MLRMANRAYASIWVRDFSEDTLLERWGEFLRTVPFSAERRGFSELVIRAVDTTETPVLEQDLRLGEYDAQVLADLARTTFTATHRTKPKLGGICGRTTREAIAGN